MTSSARARTPGGMVMPIALAVRTFRTNSNRVGCSTGRSAGLAPFRILSIYSAERRIIRVIRRVADQTTGGDVLLTSKHAGKPVRQCKVGNRRPLDTGQS